MHWLKRVLGELQTNPTFTLFDDLKLNHCEPALGLMFEAGFIRSDDMKQQLHWEDTESNRRCVVDVIKSMKRSEQRNATAAEAGDEKNVVEEEEDRYNNGSLDNGNGDNMRTRTVNG